MSGKKMIVPGDKTSRSRSVLLLWLAAFLLIVSAGQFQQAHAADPAELDVPTEERDILMFFDPTEIMVTTSARRLQPLAHATSAMYVITAEDIHQAGVTKLGDIFRMVPGMDVVTKRGDQIAVSARGFSITASRRMMVMLDGRPLYEPFGGGLDFEFLPVFPENIERIEVIRGAAGVAWGVNAVNGVINIITKKPADTQGGMITGAFGHRELYQGYLRYGGEAENMFARGTGGYFHNNGLGTHGGNQNPKDYTRKYVMTGRSDITLDDSSYLTVSGGHNDATTGNAGKGGKRRWIYDYMGLYYDKKLANGSDLAIRWFESWYDRRISGSEERISREDMIELEHRFDTGPHSIVWGADYVRDTYHANPLLPKTDIANPDDFANDQVSIYIQDEITLAKDMWLTLGYRAQHNEITHYDWAGITALVWEIKPKHFLRAAVQKSFRRPTLAEEFSNSGSGANFVKGNDDLWNERLISYELGYRRPLGERAELNVEGFVNKHSNLIGQIGANKNNQYFNTYDTTTYGVETAVDWKPYDWWLLRASHTYEHQTDRTELSDLDLGKISVYAVPKHKVTLLNRFYLDDDTTINTQLYWYDTQLTTAGDKIDPYPRFDIRASREFWDDTAELAVGVTNLQHHMHTEGAGQKVPRQIYFQFFYYF